MQLVAKAFLWVHVTLYRLTNGRIGGKFIAGSPILLLTTTGRRSGMRCPPRRYQSQNGHHQACDESLAAADRRELNVDPLT